MKGGGIRVYKAFPFFFSPPKLDYSPPFSEQFIMNEIYHDGNWECGKVI
jgi:hypothetical protein